MTVSEGRKVTMIPGKEKLIYYEHLNYRDECSFSDSKGNLK